MDRPADFPPALVQIVGPTDTWVLERLARVLAAKLPYAEFVPWQPRPSAGAALAYYVNYALYERPSGLVDVGFFTHRDDAHGFLERARRVDACVCMAQLYADWLRGQGVREVVHIPMGYDAVRYRPSLVLGVVGTLDHPRKGRQLVERLRRLPYVEVVATEGRLPDGALRELYQRVDYVLIPATVEGGPLSLLEGLAMGKPVIAPDGVGMVPEIAGTDRVLHYPAGDAEALARLAEACYRQKLRHAEPVLGRGWDRWAEDHHHLFDRLLRKLGTELPRPGPGFRFGMLQELDLPPGLDVGPLEEAVDRSAANLFYGRPVEARANLRAIAARYPSVDRLLRSLPVS